MHHTRMRQLAGEIERIPSVIRPLMEFAYRYGGSTQADGEAVRRVVGLVGVRPLLNAYYEILGSSDDADTLSRFKTEEDATPATWMPLTQIEDLELLLKPVVGWMVDPFLLDVSNAEARALAEQNRKKVLLLIEAAILTLMGSRSQ